MTRVRSERRTGEGGEDSGAENELRIHIKAKLMRSALTSQTASSIPSRTPSSILSRTATRAGQPARAADAFAMGESSRGRGEGPEAWLPVFNANGAGGGEGGEEGGEGEDEALSRGVGEGGDPPEDPTTHEKHPITGREEPGTRSLIHFASLRDSKGGAMEVYVQ